MIATYQLVIATAGVIISLSIFLWWMYRASKNDMDKRLELKADKELMEEKLRLANQRTVALEIRLIEYDEKHKEQMTSLKEDTTYLRNKTDEIYSLINSLHK